MIVRMEVFKGVVWPREPEVMPDGTTRYAYVVVGMLLTSEPLPVQKNEQLLAGRCTGLTDALAGIDHGYCRWKMGDANNVLCTLSSIESETETCTVLLDLPEKRP